MRITVTGASGVVWGKSAFTLQAGIFMNSATGLPEIYPIPEIVDGNGSVTVLYGTNDLDGKWTKITSDADRANYHFFKIVIE